jgi:hypothetical protein
MLNLPKWVLSKLFSHVGRVLCELCSISSLIFIYNRRLSYLGNWLVVKNATTDKLWIDKHWSLCCVKRLKQWYMEIIKSYLNFALCNSFISTQPYSRGLCFTCKAPACISQLFVGHLARELFFH